MSGRSSLLLACLLAVSCGDGGGRLPDGSRCGESMECLSELCLNAVCVDRSGDIDHDGLPTSLEMSLGLDPLHPDSDRDGTPDGTEYGDRTSDPLDGDRDGIIDALESSTADADLDCLPDQYDPLDAEVPAGTAELVPVVCLTEGVCASFASLVTVSCSNGTALCDYSALAQWNEDEWWCDGLDNNCNGFTDEGFYYDGVAVGYPCAGIGECGSGNVECDPIGFVTRCSTNPGASADASVPEVCDGLDNDCDSVVDNGLRWQGIPLGGTCDGTGDCGVGVVECLDQGRAACSTLEGGSKEQVVEEFCDGRDNDCDGLTDEAWSGDPSELCVFRGVCSQNPNLVGVACVDGVLACDFSDVPGYSGPSETRCDGTDDDCDGQVDEEPAFSIFEPGLGFRLPGQSCGLGVCAGGTVRCAAGGAAGECSTAEASAIEVCNDADDDCDGTVDNGMFKYWKGPPVTLVGTEPQSRVAAMLAIVETDSLVSGKLPAGVYVCGGARLIEDAALAGFTGRCWHWGFDTRRFTLLGQGPVLTGGAIVSDPGRERLLMAGVPEGGQVLKLWSMESISSGWTEVGPTVPASAVLAAGIRRGGSSLWVLVRTESGLALAQAAPDAESFELLPVDAWAEPGSFAAFDPGGGFYLWHACDRERFSYVEFIALDGTTRLDPLDQPETCMSYGAAVMPDSETMVAMSGIDREGRIGGTYVFDAVGGVWQRREVAGSGSPGAVARPGLAGVSSRGVFAYSGVDQAGRGLRRMLELDVNAPAWTVASVAGGPSPRAAGASFACRSTASAYFLGGWGDEPRGPMPVVDYWRLNLVTGLFAQIPSSDSLGPAIEAVAAVDDESGQVYLFGGLDSVPGQSASPVDIFVRYNCETGRWEKLQSGPPPRYGHSMVWSGDRLVLYGGLNNDGFLGDLWTWAPGTGWVHQGDYDLRFGHSAFWDVEGDRMLVVGGRPGGGDVSAWYDEVTGWRSDVIVEDTILDSADGRAWFDPWSRSLLHLSGTSNDALIVRFWDDYWESLPFSGLQTDLLSGFAVYDQFNRRGLLFGGLDPESGVVSSIIEMEQGCPD